MIKVVVVILFYSNLVFSIPIGIKQLSNLGFGPAAVGEPPEVILPGTSETTSNASLSVTGDALTSYTISLPSFIEMSLNGSGSGQKIRIDNFTSYPTVGANGALDGSGEQDLYIGATRTALGFGLVSGSYSGTFTVDVIY